MNILFSSLTVLLMLILSSCADYVNNMHRKIERDENLIRKSQAQKNEKNYYHPYKNKFNRDQDKKPIKDPRTISSHDMNRPTNFDVKPKIKRNYRPQRYNAEDFIDNDENGSLWTNQGAGSSLFTGQNHKHTGDMIIINVLESLRNQISSELKRLFPDRPEKKSGDKTAENEKNPGQPSTKPPGPAAENEMDMKVYDKISGTVVEEVSKDYVVLSGRKEVIFKKEKKSIEVQALVSRKDIMENDYVNSDKLLDPRVLILK